MAKMQRKRDHEGKWAWKVVSDEAAAAQAQKTEEPKSDSLATKLNKAIRK